MYRRRDNRPRPVSLRVSVKSRGEVRGIPFVIRSRRVGLSSATRSRSSISRAASVPRGQTLERQATVQIILQAIRASVIPGRAAGTADHRMDCIPPCLPQDVPMRSAREMSPHARACIESATPGVASRSLKPMKKVARCTPVRSPASGFNRAGATRRAGLEPATAGLEIRCSIRLSYRRRPAGPQRSITIHRGRQGMRWSGACPEDS